MVGRLSVVVVAAALVLSSSFSVARAERSHTVKPGQTVAAIAQRYQVTVGNLLAANGMTRSSMLREGQTLRVPERGVLFVRKGHTLSKIARDHGVTVTDLAKANRLKADAALREGQRLLLPGFSGATTRARAESRWGRPKRPGRADITRLRDNKTERLQLVDRRGRARRHAIDRLRRMMTSRRTGRRRQPHARLVQTLAHISDHFGGRPIYVISGYRPASGFTRATSRHTKGHAIDIRIQGVPNTALRDFARTLPQVGVGYYPRSSFVHVDVRKESAYWIDWSRKGQTPQYQRRGAPPPSDATADELRRAGIEGVTESDDSTISEREAAEENSDDVAETEDISDEADEGDAHEGGHALAAPTPPADGVREE